MRGFRSSRSPRRTRLSVSLKSRLTPPSTPTHTSQSQPPICMRVPRGPRKQTRVRAKKASSNASHCASRLRSHVGAAPKGGGEPIGCRHAARHPGRPVISTSICNGIFFLWLREHTKRLFSRATSHPLRPPTPPPLHSAYADTRLSLFMKPL